MAKGKIIMTSHEYSGIYGKLSFLSDLIVIGFVMVLVIPIALVATIIAVVQGKLQ